MTATVDTENQPDAMTVERYFGLTGVFTRTVLADPSVMDNIPQRATLVFIRRGLQVESEP
jgi:hypothetical protein